MTDDLMTTNVEFFNITCKRCGGENVLLGGMSNVPGGVGELRCLDCRNYEYGEEGC